MTYELKSLSEIITDVKNDLYSFSTSIRLELTNGYKYIINNTNLCTPFTWPITLLVFIFKNDTEGLSTLAMIFICIIYYSLFYNMLTIVIPTYYINGCLFLITICLITGLMFCFFRYIWSLRYNITLIYKKV